MSEPTTARDRETLHAYVLGVVKRIEAGARALALLDEHAGWSVGDLTDGGSLLDKLAAARETLELPPATHDDDVAAGLDELDRTDVLLDSPLEVKVTGSVSTAWLDVGWEVDGVTVVVCTGGPHVELRYDGCSVRAVGCWGGAWVDLPLLDDTAYHMVRELLDEHMAMVGGVAR